MNNRSIYLLSLMLLGGFLRGEAKVVTPSQATSVASSFYQAETGMAKTFAIRGKTWTPWASLRLPSSIPPACYVVSGTDGKGLVIVAGDDVARPILGFAPEATLAADGTLPPPMQEWLSDMERQIRQAQANGMEQSQEVARQWMDPQAGDVVFEMETAKWGQGMPYKAQCPKDNDTICATGGVPTAYAILMKYYEQPAQGNDTTELYYTRTKHLPVPSRDLNHPYDWKNMPLEYKAGEYTDEEADNVAQLMADIGAAIKADYSNSGTTGSVVRSPVFRHFGYNPGTYKRKSDYADNEWNALLRQEIGKNRPVLYRGQGAADDAGHAFILYGYTDDDYFCVNWGWNGSHNGLFALDALNIGTTDYNSSQAACFDLVPANMLTTTATVDGQDYPSLMAAINAAADSIQTTIKLVDDAEAAYVVIGEAKDIIIDLNGHKVDFDSRGIYNYGTLTITDSSDDASGKMQMSDGNLSMIFNYGTLTIEKGSFLCDMPAPGGTDARRCLLSFAKSKTLVKGGVFTSTHQVLCTNGDVTIEDGRFTSQGNADVVANYCTEEQLLIKGGTFTNTADAPTDADHRRCLWTTTGANTVIEGGTFVSNAQVVYSRGNTTIDNGKFTSEGNATILLNYSTNGQLTINGGTFTNLSDKPKNTDARRCLYTMNGTKTVINDGSFISAYQVIVTNGDATVSGGEFTSMGNTNVVGNYNTEGEMVISGGTFVNLSDLNDDTDSRRCFWASMGTTTLISNGTFTNNSTAQTVTIYGKATISGGTYENKGQGSGIASNGEVEITDCRVSAWNPLLCWEAGSMTVSGGLYSKEIDEKLISEGYSCVENDDPATMEKYPYRVSDGGLVGDVNGDGSVDVADIATVISVMAKGTEPQSGTAPNPADVNGDGVVDVADIATIISIMASH